MGDSEKVYPIIISDRVQKEWIPGCPVQVKQIRISREKEDAGLAVCIISVVCGDFQIKDYVADIAYTGAKRQAVGKSEGIVLTAGESLPVEVPYEDAVYAAVIIRSVHYADGKVWTNAEGSRGTIFPEQDIFWQTDPLYDAIQFECAGVTTAKYKPDKIDGAWRCTCGQINLDDAKVCGACGCSLEWLETHLEPTYLEKRRLEIADKSEKKTEKLKKRREHAVSDGAKMIIILASFVLAAVLIVLTFTTFIPLGRYNKAVKLADSGEFDEAIAIFNDLGNFKNAAAMAGETSHRKAQTITGLDEVYMTTNAAEPWFSITADGVLSFKKDDYTGTWNNFIVPDVVDGVVVRELDRNFFMNCKELTVVTISDCVEILGEQCFYNCELLHTVNFGKSVTTIMPRAFMNCAALEEIEIPDTVTYLGLRVFNNCIKLNKVVLGSGITEIASYQFSLCIELERVTLKSPISSVGEYAFSECAKLAKIHCRFQESSWTNPAVAEGNEAYTAAEIIFE